MSRLATAASLALLAVALVASCRGTAGAGVVPTTAILKQGTLIGPDGGSLIVSGNQASAPAAPAATPCVPAATPAAAAVQASPTPAPEPTPNERKTLTAASPSPSPSPSPTAPPCD